MAASEDFSQEIAQLRKDLNTLQGDLSGLVTALKNAGLEQGKESYDQLRKQADALRQKGEGAIGAVGQKIDEKPVTSVLTAFGTGFVIGMLLNNRR